jgi:hypothetical protein
MRTLLIILSIVFSQFVASESFALNWEERSYRKVERKAKFEKKKRDCIQKRILSGKKPAPGLCGLKLRSQNAWSGVKKGGKATGKFFGKVGKGIGRTANSVGGWTAKTAKKGFNGAKKGFKKAGKWTKCTFNKKCRKERRAKRRLERAQRWQDQYGS